MEKNKCKEEEKGAPNGMHKQTHNVMDHFSRTSCRHWRRRKKLAISFASMPSRAAVSGKCSCHWRSPRRMRFQFSRPLTRAMRAAQNILLAAHL